MVPLFPDPDIYLEVYPGIYIGPSRNESDYINHSCDPNCIMVNKILFAIKDIKTGEQITYDYSNFIYDDWYMDCLCGSENCKGRIDRSKNTRLHDR